MRLGGTKATAIHQYRGLGNQLYDLAGSRPSLDLRFAENKSLVDSVSGQNLITFTRASTGTYVDSDGVIRSAATNLLLRSEEFDNASWTKITATVSANATAAPNGASSADKLIVDNAQSAGYAAQTTSFVSGTVYTVSCYAKAAEVSDFRFVFESAAFTANLNAVFNLSTGVVSSFTASSASIQSIGNGWYRCIATATATTTASASVQFRSVHSGNGTNGIFLWGAQLEVGSTATTYLPTGATINSAPRFDHNPLTGECLGLLVEEQRQNLLLRSEEFDVEATWGRVSTSVTANTDIAPNGSLSADRLTWGALQTAEIYQLVTLAAASHTFSVWAKTASGTKKFRLKYWNGTVDAFSSELTATTTWQRFSYTFTGVAALGNVSIRNSSPADAGDIVVWGAQLEAGAFPTSYIKTEAAAATRTADIASISGTNFSSWYRQDEGTVFAEARTQQSAGGHVLAGFSTGAFASSAYISKESDNLLRVAPDASPSNLNIALQSVTSNVALRSALAFTAGTGSASAVMNAGTIGTDISTGIPTTMAQMSVGSAPWNIGSNSWNGTIKRITYFPQRLPNSTLQSITQ